MLPTPSLIDLGKAFLSRRTFGDSFVATPWLRNGDLPQWLARSAWSLKVIARWRHSFHPERKVRWWLPNFFCSQSLAGLRGGGNDLVFYTLDDRCHPDWGACRKLAETAAPDVFVLVHYFGIPSDVVGAVAFCEQRDPPHR